MSRRIVFRGGDGRIVARGHRRHPWLHVETPAADFRIQSLFRQSVPSVEVLPAVDAKPADISRTLRHVVYPLALAATGQVVLHASAVRGPSTTLLFLGPSGVGKSTLARCLGGRGWAILADDAVVLEATSGQLAAICPSEFFEGAKAGARERGKVAASAQAGKVAAVCPERGARGEVPRLEALRGSAALTAVVPHLHTFDPEDPCERRRLAARALEVVTQLSVWRLRVGEGPAGLAAALDLVERRFAPVSS